MVEPAKKPVFFKEPFPKVFSPKDAPNGVFAAGAVITLEYLNKSDESSEIRSVQFKCDPRILVVVRKTVRGVETTILEQVNLNAIQNIWNFKEYTSKPLNVGINQKLIIEMTNTTGFAQPFTVLVDKDRITWFQSATGA